MKEIKPLKQYLDHHQTLFVVWRPADRTELNTQVINNTGDIRLLTWFPWQQRLDGAGSFVAMPLESGGGSFFFPFFPLSKPF